MSDVVIVSMARTPFGKFGGALKSLSATDLGGLAIKEALRRIDLEGSAVDEVIMGTVVAAGQGQIPARQASIKGGIPHDIPVLNINKVCGSALKAVTLGAQIIKANDAEIIVAGGMESMSNIPFLSRDTRWGARMGNISVEDGMLTDGLMCPENNVHMAVIGGAVASEYNVTREQQDAWALRSQMLWDKAEKLGLFDEERFDIEISTRKGTTIVSKDESPRPSTTKEDLEKLKPLFIKDGTITAGNAPGTNDGATAVVLMSRKKANELNIPILAIVKDYAQVARESKYIATVPGLAIEKLINKTNKSIYDFDLIEINEAFAAVPLVSCKILGLTDKEMDERVNVNGSAVAVGHPIGATGARILMTLIYEMRRNNKKNGICAICSGMAQGDAVWVEVE